MAMPLSILYVDDSPYDRELVRAALAAEEGVFRLVEAATAAEFEARLGEAGWDAVLSDFNILGFDGLQVLALVKARDVHIPVVIVTGTGSEEVAVEAIKRGAADYVIKSVKHIQRLPQIIRNAIQQAQLQLAHERATKALFRLSRARLVMAECNHALVHASEPLVLLHEMCQLLIGLAHYDHACIRLADEAGQLAIAAQAGVAQAGDVPPLSMALPLQSGAQLLGELTLETSEPDAFDDDEMKLLAELADDIAFGITALRTQSERKEQQTKIARLSRIQAVLSGINSAIVRIHERQALFDEACRIAVEHGGFDLAGIGLLTGESLRLMSSMRREGMPAGSPEVLYDATLEAALLGNMQRSQQAVFCNDSSQALDGQRLRSVAALPLLLDDACIGAMLLYAPEAGFFDAEEIKLLNELAGDISFALKYIERAERVDYLAWYDPLTGLPNARLFNERLAQLLLTDERGNHQLAVILIDLDRFKRLNDSLGRHVGDAVLRQVAQRLPAKLHEPYTLARVGPDTFAVAVSGLRQASDAATLLLDRLLPEISAPLVGSHPGNNVQITARGGIALFPTDGTDAETLFRNAESALKQAQLQGEPSLFYAPEMNALVTGKLMLEEHLRRALDENQLILHYQPKVSATGGQIVGAEALVRWQHPEHGLISPADFIPLAEETGLIVPLGEWVIDAVCAQLARWHAAGLDLVPVAVNLSALQFRRGNVLQVIRQSLQRYDIPPKYLSLELTETIVMQDAPAATAVLDGFRQLGLPLALDDFGTGYSSLAYLKRLPFDALKIDRAFVSEITHKSEDAAIASAVIAMAHQLNLRVIAEGVETQGQFDYLRRHDCDEIQGYFFSRPVPADDFAALLQRGRFEIPVNDAREVRQRTVLLVDDEASVRTALRRILLYEDYRVLEACCGSEALDVLASNSVQVIISDQNMPGMSGLEFLDVVRQLYPDTMRILLTGHADLDAVINAVNSGAVYKFFTKPWQNDLLLGHIREAFRHYRWPRVEALPDEHKSIGVESTWPTN